jgi:hypothetical protein
LIDLDISRPGVVRFSHALVADALVAELNPIKRAQAHLRVVGALEDHRSADLDAVLPQLAFHSFAGASVGGAMSALDYSVRAAEAALQIHAARTRSRIWTGPSRCSIDATRPTNVAASPC